APAGGRAGGLGGGGRAWPPGNAGRPLGGGRPGFPRGPPPARGNPGAQRRGRMMGAQRFLVTFCRVWQKVTRRKGEKVSKRRHRKWTMREIKTSTFPLFGKRPANSPCVSQAGTH
ncbi:hypothetical protein EFK07_30920, partial [Pseudomonas putida]